MKDDLVLGWSTCGTSVASGMGSLCVWHAEDRELGRQHSGRYVRGQKETQQLGQRKGLEHSRIMGGLKVGPY